MNTVIRAVEKSFVSDKPVDYHAGDTISVSLKIQEGNKSRIQQYQGIVVQKSGTGLGATITVRKASSNNIFVEKIFPIHSPLVSEIKIIRKGRVKRARLYYLRDKTGKEATRIQEKK